MKKSVLVSFIILALLASGGSAAGIYYYMQYKKAELRANDPTIVVKETMEKVGKLVDLPADEQPTVATVNNPEAIADQPFFAKAKKGDVVILYPNARIAILYDEVANKIINFGTINLTDTATDSAVPIQNESGEQPVVPVP